MRGEERGRGKEGERERGKREESERCASEREKEKVEVRAETRKRTYQDHVCCRKLNERATDIRQNFERANVSSGRGGDRSLVWLLLREGSVPR